MKIVVKMAVWDQIYLEKVVFLVCMPTDFSENLSRCREQDFFSLKSCAGSSAVHHFYHPHSWICIIMFFYPFVQCGCRNCSVAAAQ